MEDSGKEDVFSLLFGQEKIDSGEIVVQSQELYTDESKNRGTCGWFLCLSIMMNRWFAELSVAENLYIV